MVHSQIVQVIYVVYIVVNLTRPLKMLILFLIMTKKWHLPVSFHVLHNAPTSLELGLYNWNCKQYSKTIDTYLQEIYATVSNVIEEQSVKCPIVSVSIDGAHRRTWVELALEWAMLTHANKKTNTLSMLVVL